MRRPWTLFIALAAMPATASAQQPAAAPPTESPRTLTFEIRQGDQLIAAPTLQVQVGRPAAFSVGDYSLRLRMDRAVGGGEGPAPYVIRSSLYRTGSGWTLLASPALTVAEGGQARHQVAGSDLSLAVAMR